MVTQDRPQGSGVRDQLAKMLRIDMIFLGPSTWNRQDPPAPNPRPTSSPVHFDKNAKFFDPKTTAATSTSSRTPRSSTRIRQVLPRGCQVFTPNAKTDLMATTRQDLRDDKIDTDQGESDAPRRRTKSFFPERQDLLRYPRTIPPRPNPRSGP